MDETRRQLIRTYFEKALAKLEVAGELLRNGHHDDAVSRAYYAAFHAAQAALLFEGQTAETHRGVVTLFGMLLVKSGKIEARYGKKLSNLKDDRETGDYEAVSYLDEDSAQTAVREATEFCEAIREFLRTNGILA